MLSQLAARHAQRQQDNLSESHHSIQQSGDIAACSKEAAVKATSLSGIQTDGKL